jgi:putative spermidine/putrescine transport system ATP-binding protein
MAAKLMKNLHDVALDVRAVAKDFGAVAALRDISLTLGRGEFLTMLGPSGSGKTTTLRVIAGFLRPDAGEVLINGVNVVDTPPHRRNIGMVFQDYALFPHMTVRDNVGFPLEARGVTAAARRSQAEDMLSIVGLGPFGDRYPRQLSGGQQQRVALARALVFKPDIVLLDEPLAALDKKLRGSMQLEIMRIVRQLGTTVVSVTHDQEEALVMSDRIAVFDHGRLVQIGSPRELYERPATEFVADFVGEANLLQGHVVRRGDRAAVEGGAWRAPLPDAGADWADGLPVSVAVRPEKISVAAPSAANTRVDLHCRGTVRESIYLGVEHRLIVELSNGEPIRVRSRSADALFQNGAQVDLCWNPADTVVLRRDAASPPGGRAASSFPGGGDSK